MLTLSRTIDLPLASPQAFPHASHSIYLSVASYAVTIRTILLKTKHQINREQSMALWEIDKELEVFKTKVTHNMYATFFAISMKKITPKTE